MSLGTFGLDHIHYYSLPGLSWDAMFKYTCAELDFITGTDMYQMMERGIREGISNISHRYATSSHTYNKNEKTRTLTYQDAYSYSWAMPQPLPVRDFKWVSPNGIDILNVPKDNKLGYILGVDLKYPEKLHGKHNLYPLAPEHVQPTGDMLSPVHRKHFPSIHGAVRKLVPNLHSKKKYVIHYQNLQLYVRLKDGN